MWAASIYCAIRLRKNTSVATIAIADSFEKGSTIAIADRFEKRIGDRLPIVLKKDRRSLHDRFENSHHSNAKQRHNNRQFRARCMTSLYNIDKMLLFSISLFVI